MPPVPAAASSVVAHDRPAAPRSWMPTTRSSAKISRQHSISTFSANGSPTCTLGRLLLPLALEGRAGQHGRPADAVAAGPRAEQHDVVARPVGLGQLDRVGAQDPDAERVDERVAEVGLVEHDLAADVRQAQAVAVAADAGDDARQHPGGVGRVDAGPKRSESMTATGRAPMVRMSRTMPPTPVAAPWCGST